MKKLGKFMLFFSSYLILFLILMLYEINNLASPFKLTTDYIVTNKVVFVSVLIYLILLVLSIISLIFFVKNYQFGILSNRRTIKVSSIANSSSEVISYLLTMILPLVTIDPLSKMISDNNWIKLISMIVVLLVVLLLYTNSNLVVVNPMLMVFGYSLYKINYFSNKSKPILIEGILLTKSSFDAENKGSPITVFKIDKSIFMHRVI